MKKFVDYIMAQPVWKVLLYGLGILFMIFNPETILPFLFLGGAIALWYFVKKKPNVAKRNIAALVAILGAGGIYLTNPHTVSTTQEEQTQATHFASTPSKKDENAKKKAEAKREKEAKEKAEKEKKEKEDRDKKAKEEQERKEKEDRDKKTKEEQERKEKEERDKKEAEAKQLAEQAEASVQALENNQVTENIAPAQAAVELVVDPKVKSTLTDRIGRVQNAINVRAQQAAAVVPQPQPQPQPQQGSYRNCSEARAAGVAPLHRGDPGYSPRLDRDGDGLACE